ncbi:Nucleoside-diphosphate-sugar epimerase [Dyella jiangningensis]|uniref:NAD-dependent epimerase/dehydratase family protein n=1 Tax=Dyella sp. AtDHG13 TaxID=1938897 RepID=UPI00089013EF|nr:NAD-dependent epimerase/dehydratase family protein [Dyella sp. AtDHG13]PXV58683.1 nucleoside-diphosphate-sugar epimerase [Dyella sp. AtDHG13]SDJ86604.1 Nucleoside-diphosphate-sugar epimerase [Dyella jiangningensis]
MQTQRTVLVIGANGGIGQEACLALLRHGWRVRALVRKAPAAAQNIDWRIGDAMRRVDVIEAASGVDVIVHAVNPPGYRGWEQRVLPMLDNTIAAAEASGARIVLPGTVYNYGPDAFPLLGEDAPQHPLTRKGEIRAEMERRLEAAAHAGGRVLVLRCGDFFGPRAGNNWFAQGLVQAGKPVTRVAYPGDYAIGHCWAYLPDVAETLARLLDRENELARFERFHFGGYWLDGHAMLAAICRATHNDAIKAGRFPWWLARLASPFNETLRELCKMRYLWQASVQLDDRKLKAFLGADLYTPIDQAVAAALTGAGCMPTSAHHAAAHA